MEDRATIFQINAGVGMPKLPIGHIQVTEEGLVGDSPRHPKPDGRLERALCIYSLDCILALQAEGHPIYPGAMGENLTLIGVDWAKMEPGTCIQLGAEVLIEITGYTNPCSKITDYFLEGNIARVSQKKYPGWSRVYGQVLNTGEIKIGDPVTVIKSERQEASKA